MKEGQDSSAAAKARWKLLAQALKKKKSSSLHNQDTSEFSVRNFTGFDLYHVTSLDSSNLYERWLDYKLKNNPDSQSTHVRLLDDKFSAKELFGFNNTGIWPSEEVLGYYCCNRKDLFRNKRVIELGCGMTALAGLQLAVNTDASGVLLTDGNEKGIENLQVMLERNSKLFNGTSTHTRVLKWQKYYNEDTNKALEHSFDVIISADCLFFVDLHEVLISTLNFLMADKGQCIFMAPRRSGTLEKFVGIAKKCFDVTVEENYDELMWGKHEYHLLNTPSYNTDLHFPVLVKLTK